MSEAKPNEVPSEAFPPWREADAKEAFTIKFPAGCSMKAEDTMMDFEIFRVSCDGAAYVGVYAGNAADSEMPRSRTLKTPYDYPAQIQVWTVSTAGDRKKADRIAASVEVRTDAEVTTR